MADAKWEMAEEKCKTQRCETGDTRIEVAIAAPAELMGWADLEGHSVQLAQSFG